MVLLKWEMISCWVVVKGISRVVFMVRVLERIVIFVEI